MFPWSELKHLFTYSPIHFLLFTTPNNWQKITKFSCENDFLCTTKVHAPCILSGNKMKKTENFLWSELKDLFTYSPIHLFAPIFPFGILGMLDQNSAEAFQPTRIGRMRLNQPKTVTPPPTIPNCAGILICHRKCDWVATHVWYMLRLSGNKMKNGWLRFLGPS